MARMVMDLHMEPTDFREDDVKALLPENYTLVRILGVDIGSRGFGFLGHRPMTVICLVDVELKEIERE